jgi:phosphoglycerate kinase
LEEEEGMKKMGLRGLAVAGKRVLVRVDFNVPIRESSVADDTRIRATLPTIRHLVDGGARVVLLSHLGRPKGKPNPEMSLQPVAACLAELLGRSVSFGADCVGEAASKAVSELSDGDVVLLENVRFHAEETENDPAFAAQLSTLGDLYVNDAFGSAHRAHASTEGVARLLKPAVAGFLMEKELAYLGSALEEPKRPFVAILGGAKVSGKIEVIENLMTKVDSLAIGGAMMFTFLRAQGKQTGGSLVEEDRLAVASRLLARFSGGTVDVHLPADCRAAASTDGTDPGAIVPVAEIPADRIGVDIGPATITEFSDVIAKASTVVWNGPMGIFEVPSYAEGTRAIARALAEATGRGAVTIVGGGDSAAAINREGLVDRISHVSTGGGASLEFLEGKQLPGVAALTDAGA